MVSREEFKVDSGGILLAAGLFAPAGPGPHPGLIICHGMPAGPPLAPGQASTDEGISYPELAERGARLGFATLIFNFRGTGESGGNYHPLGWAQDLEAALAWMRQEPLVDAGRIAFLGSSLGGAVTIYVAAHHTDVAAVVSYASPAVMEPWADAADAVNRLRALGVIRDQAFPPSLEAWGQEHRELSPVRWVGAVAPQPILLLHGEDDDVVPAGDAHTLFAQAGEPKELRLLAGAGHRFRREEGAIGIALEWLCVRFLAPPENPGR